MRTPDFVLAGARVKDMSLLSFERKVSVGDILTSMSILVSAFALAWQLAKDHNLERQKQANEIRSAGAKTLAAVER
jgi:hypothetical protein